MSEEKKETLKQGLILALFVLVVPTLLYRGCTALTTHDIEEVRTEIESHLYEKYGEEFVVDRIGTRSSRGDEFFQARIYPKSIVGTNKEGDDYYYASASVDKRGLGRLGGVGDSYELVNLKLDIKNHIRPTAKKFC